MNEMWVTLAYVLVLAMILLLCGFPIYGPFFL